MSDESKEREIDDAIRRNLLKGLGVSALGLAAASEAGANESNRTQQQGPYDLTENNTNLAVVSSEDLQREDPFTASPNAQAKVVLTGDVTTGGAATQGNLDPLQLGYQLIFVETGAQGGVDVTQPSFGEGTPPCFAGTINLRQTGDWRREHEFALRALAPTEGQTSYTLYAIMANLGKVGDGLTTDDLLIQSSDFTVALPGAGGGGGQTTTTTQTGGDGGQTTTTTQTGGRTGATTTTEQ